MRYVRVIAALALVLTTLGLSHSSEAATGERYFPQTGHSVVGVFLSYWQQHGGLERFGYPLSDEIDEVSDFNGQTYAVQYFERAEFEHHPENQPPYDVELTQLGTLWFKQRYPASAHDQAVTYSGRYFPQTDKYLADELFDTWQKFGGVTGIGYPISNEFGETSELDGKNYIVQYFERAEFEYHDELNPPVVLLSQLGRFRYNERNLVSGSTPLLIASYPWYVNQVVAAGRYIFWVGARYEQGSDECREVCIYGYDIATQHVFIVDKSQLTYSNLRTDGDWLVWLLDYVHGGVNLAYDTHQKMEHDVANYYDGDGGPGYGSRISDFALGSGIWYYVDNANGHTGLFARNLAAKSEQLISANGSDPVAGGGTLLWSESDSAGNESLHLLINDDLNTARTLAKGSKDTFLGYKVSSSKAAWLTANPAGGVSINLYDIASATIAVIPIASIADWTLGDSKLAWVVPQSDKPYADARGIQSYDISSGQTSTILNNVTGKMYVSAILNENTLLFSTDNNVYLLNIDAAAATGGDIPESTPQIRAKDAHLLDNVVQNYKACGSYIVWQRSENNIATDPIYAYNTDIGATFTVTDQPATGRRTLFACDDKTLLWHESNADGKLYGYDFASRQQSAIPKLNGAFLTIGDGSIYYRSDRDVHAYSLAHRQDRFVFTLTDDFISAMAYSNGTLLWSQGNPEIYPNKPTMHVFRLDGSLGDTVIAQTPNSESSFDPVELSADYAAWAYQSSIPGNSSTDVTVYQISAGAQTVIQTGQFVEPHIGSSLVVWREQGGIIKAYHINSGDLETLATGLSLVEVTYANQGTNFVSPRPVGQNIIAFMVYGLHGYTSLYLATLKLPKEPMTHPIPDLSIIIVNYNTCDLLEACLASVYVDLGQGSASVAAEVIVVDNASQDGSMAMVHRMFPQAILIESEVNLGYGGGANLGLMVAQGRDLMLLNSDTVVLDGALRYLVEFMAAHPDAGACGPRLLNADGSVQRSAFRFPTLAQVALDLFPIFPRLTDTALNGRYAQDSTANDSSFPVDFALGAAFVVSRDVYEKTGGFDEDFFMYAEEVDWAMRIHAAGYNFYSVPAAHIIHYAGQSVKQAPGRMYYELFRSRALLYRKHYSSAFQLTARLLTRAAMLQRALTDWWRNRRGKLGDSELHQSWQVYGKIFRL